MNLRVRITWSKIVLAGSIALLAAGCSSTRHSTASDDSFFIPLKEFPRPAETKPQAAVIPDVRPPESGKADSLLNSQQDQERRIGALAAQLERLESARRGGRPDSAKPEKPATQPVVAPKPVAKPAESKTIAEAERLYAAQEYRKTIQWCQELFDRRVDTGIEDRCHFLIGASHFRLRQFDLALVSLKKVLEIKGSVKRADASFILGLAYRQLGMRQRAASMFEAALKESPGDDLARSIRQELDRLARNR